MSDCLSSADPDSTIMHTRSISGISKPKLLDSDFLAHIHTNHPVPKAFSAILETLSQPTIFPSNIVGGWLNQLLRPVDNKAFLFLSKMPVFFIINQ